MRLHTFDNGGYKNIQRQKHASSKLFGQLNPSDGLIFQLQPSVCLWMFGGIKTVFKNQHLGCDQKYMTSYEITFMEMKYKLKPASLFNKYSYKQSFKIFRDVVSKNHIIRIQMNCMLISSYIFKTIRIKKKRQNKVIGYTTESFS